MMSERKRFGQGVPSQAEWGQFNTKYLAGYQSPELSVERTHRLSELIKSDIQSRGPITYSDYMRHALSHPEYGYYTQQVEIGASKDFSTNPERSKLYGAAVGNGIMSVWEALGKPKEFDITEIGAGTGALAEGILEYARKHHRSFYNAITYTIIEPSPKLMVNQLERLQEYAWQDQDKGKGKVLWEQASIFDATKKVKMGVFLSNEVPDVFPADVVSRQNGGVRQKYVELSEDNQLQETWGEPTTQVNNFIQQFGIDVKENIEEPITLGLVEFQKKLDRDLEYGAIITTDYGSETEIGQKTNRTAIRYKGAALTNRDELNQPGKLDITTDINFHVLEEVAREDGVMQIGILPERYFLLQNGMGKLAGEHIRLLEERQPMRLERLEEIIRDISGFNNILEPSEPFTQFYTQILVKGIRGLSFDTAVRGHPEDYQVEMPTVSVALPKAFLSSHTGGGNMLVECDKKEVLRRHGYELDEEHSYKDPAFVSPEGTISLAPDEVWGTVIYPHGSKEPILDLRERGAAVKVISQKYPVH